MRYWANLGFLAPDQLVEVARAAERFGFEGLSLPDHLLFPAHVDSAYPYSENGEMTWPADAPWPDCWVTIGVLAAATERLRLCTGVYVAPLRDPFSLAKAVATAAGFGPGRVACGFGAGWLREEFDVVGQDFATRGPRLDEVLEVLRLLWSGETVEHHGRHLDFGPLRMLPAAPGVPLLLGGNSGPALRRAARHDGWIGSYTGVDAVAAMLRDLADRRAALGRAGAPFEVLLASGPGGAKVAEELGGLDVDGLGIDGLIVPAMRLGPSSSTPDVIAGLERFADRWIR